MSEDCQKCGTAMWELDEDSYCPGCSDIEPEIDLLTTCGTFDTNDCISTKDFWKLLEDNTDWKLWIISRIIEENIEQYISWYVRMSERGAICEGLRDAHNEMFKEFGEKV